LTFYDHFKCCYTPCSNKGCHQTHGGNFVKSQRLFKVLLRLERELISTGEFFFENRLRFDDVTNLSLMAPFFGTRCIRHSLLQHDKILSVIVSQWYIKLQTEIQFISHTNVFSETKQGFHILNLLLWASWTDFTHSLTHMISQLINK